jgi:hypothetical protein
MRYLLHFKSIYSIIGVIINNRITHILTPNKKCQPTDRLRIGDLDLWYENTTI